MLRARAQRLLGYFLVSFGSLGFQYAFGPIYAELLEQLDGSREVTSLVASLCVGIMDMLGFVSGALVLRYGSRRCCITASLLTSIGWGLSAVVQEPWQLLMTYSLLVGVGHSLALYSAIVCIGRWFSRRLALAHALPNTGGALTPLLMGLLAPALFDAVGWRGSFLALGGLNGAALLVAGCLLTPPPAETIQSTITVTSPALQNDVTVPPPKGDSAPSSRPQPPPSPERREEAGLSEVVRGRRLQLLCTSLLGFGLGGWMMVVHLVKMARDGGMDESRATRLLTFLSLGSATVRMPWAYLVRYSGQTPPSVAHDTTEPQSAPARRLLCLPQGAWLLSSPHFRQRPSDESRCDTQADRAGRRRAVSMAMAVLSVVHLACAFAAARASPGFLAFLAYCVGGFNGSVLSCSASLPAELLPPRHQRLAQAGVYTPIGVGFIVGPLAAAALQRSSGDYASSAVLASVCFALGAALMLYLSVLPPVDDASARRSKVEKVNAS